VGGFFIWCAGANKDVLDRSERARYVMMGLFIVLVSLAGFGSMFVLAGYALSSLPLEARLALAGFWSLVIFTFDRTIAATVNMGGWWRGLLIYVPRILIAFLLAMLVTEPVVLKLFEKEINEQIRVKADDAQTEIRKRADQKFRGEQLKIDARVVEARSRITELESAARQYRADAQKVEQAETGSSGSSCGFRCRVMSRKAERRETKARNLRAELLPKLQRERAGPQGELDKKRQAWIEEEDKKRPPADGLLGRHLALSEYLRGHGTAEAIRWAITLLLFLFELSIVLIKWTGSVHDKVVKHRLQDTLLWEEARARARRERIDEYAGRDVEKDLELELVFANERRELLRADELRRLRRTWFRRADAPETATATAATAATAVMTDWGHTPTPPLNGDPFPASPRPPGDDIHEPRPGEMVAHRYQLVEEIGSGGYGVVYRAYDTFRRNREVAVKISERRLAHAWWNEVHHTAGGPYIAELLKAGEVNNAYNYLVYPLYRPGSLYLYCTKGAGVERDLRWSLKIVEQVLFALAAAHRAGRAHFDIKPDNILLDESADGAMTARVADWGISRGADDADRRPGHWRWCAVELIMPQNGQVRGELVDLYAVGTLAYWLISGRVPLERELVVNGLPLSVDGRLTARSRMVAPAPLNRLNAEVSTELAALVGGWLQDDPNRRAGAGPHEDAMLRALRQLRAVRDR
jgi:hypothetical protein